MSPVFHLETEGDIYKRLLEEDVFVFASDSFWQ